MKHFLIGFAMILTVGGAFADEIEDSCRACHRGDLALDAMSAADLAALIRSMRDGDAEHIVPMPVLSDEEIAALAAALAAS